MSTMQPNEAIIRMRARMETTKARMHTEFLRDNKDGSSAEFDTIFNQLPTSEYDPITDEDFREYLLLEQNPCHENDQRRAERLRHEENQRIADLAIQIEVDRRQIDAEFAEQRARRRERHTGIRLTERERERHERLVYEGQKLAGYVR